MREETGGVTNGAPGSPPPRDSSVAGEGILGRRLLRMPFRLHRPWVHALLFVVTFISTFVTYRFALPMLDGGGTRSVEHALLYSATLLAILAAHEMGHYAFCYAHRVPATLPYFIPAPFTFFGTMGAVIRMGGPIRSRRTLFDIAVAGPLAGLALAVPALVWGIAHSPVIGAADAPAIEVGEPLLVKGILRAVLGPIPDGATVALHPVAFAGWAGLFVTALNLLPAGQLDGGHVTYALLGRRSRAIGFAVVVGLVSLALVTGFQSWYVFAAVLFLFGLRHPPTLADRRPLDRARAVLGVGMLVLFALCFTPVPITFR